MDYRFGSTPTLHLAATVKYLNSLGRFPRESYAIDQSGALPRHLISLLTDVRLFGEWITAGGVCFGWGEVAAAF